VSKDTNNILRYKRQIVGFNDDILDMKFIPKTTQNSFYFDQISKKSNSENENVDAAENANSLPPYALGIITNSSQVCTIFVYQYSL
jgi:hypothetical protein